MGIEYLVNMVKIAILDSGVSATIKLQSDDKFTEPISYEDMTSLLEKNNIVFGVNNDLVKKICALPEFYRNKEVEIAKGIPPQVGDDAYIKWEVSVKKDKTPLELPDGKVDFHNVMQISNIKQGELIAEKIPCTDGIPGKSISGADIPGKRGKDVLLKPGKNVVLNESKDKLYAAIDGQVVFTEQNKVNVFPIYEVTGDLDLSIGNIDFVGTVIIRGNVPDGFRIHAAGDIKVYGNVEGSELVAGGSIFIQQGIIGHNKSFIKAGKDFQAAFVLDGNVYAEENVLVSQSIMHSQVSAGNQLICKGIKGIIVGGRIQAGELVIASIIGNPMATATVIEAGINPEIRRKLNELLKKKDELNESLDKINKGLSLLDRLQSTEGNLSPEKKKLQLSLLNQQLIYDKEIKKLKIEEEEIEEIISKYDSASIQVYRMIYPGVKLVIGKAVKFINSETQYMKFILDEGVVVSRHI